MPIKSVVALTATTVLLQPCFAALPFPFGITAGDRILERGGKTVLSQSWPLLSFGAYPVTFIDLCSDGYMTLVGGNSLGMSSYEDGINFGQIYNDTNQPRADIIAPYWCDADTSTDSQSGSERTNLVYARRHGSRRSADISTARNLVRASGGPSDFRPDNVFVATWDQVEKAPSTGSGPTNTFQAALAVDRHQTYLIIAYDSMNWFEQNPSNGHCSAGYSFRSGGRDIAHVSNASDLSELAQRSNVGQPGVYVHLVGFTQHANLGRNRNTPAFQYGSSAGDSRNRIDRIPSEGLQPFNLTIPLGDSTFNQAQVAKDGAILLGQPFDFTVDGPLEFPSTAVPTLVAAYLDDFRTPHGLFDDTAPRDYLYVRHVQAVDQLALANSIIANSQALSDRSFFSATDLIVATWDRTELHAPSIFTPRRKVTFQCAIATDGNSAFAIMSYINLQWFSHSTKVGVNFGSGSQGNHDGNWFNIDNADAFRRLLRGTNMNRCSGLDSRGVFVFDLNNIQTAVHEDFECDSPTQTPSLAPTLARQQTNEPGLTCACPDGSFVEPGPIATCEEACPTCCDVLIAPTCATGLDPVCCSDGTWDCLTNESADVCVGKPLRTDGWLNFAPECPTDSGCDSDIHRCPDGTIVERDPENECAFVCPPCCDRLLAPICDSGVDPMCCSDSRWDCLTEESPNLCVGAPFRTDGWLQFGQPCLDDSSSGVGNRGRDLQTSNKLRGRK